MPHTPLKSPSSPRLSLSEQGVVGGVELVARATGSAVLVHVRATAQRALLLFL